jgi:hypothetical protein
MKATNSNAVKETTTQTDELEVHKTDAADSDATRPTDPTTEAHRIVENSSSSPDVDEANMIADTNAIIDNNSAPIMTDAAPDVDTIPGTQHTPKASSMPMHIVVESLPIPAEEKLEEEDVMAHEISTNAPHYSPHTAYNQPVHKIHPSPISEVVPPVPSWRQHTSSPTLKLLSLPVDSLHCIASFLTASDWAKFGQTTTIATPICRDVFTRVRMHGFRCATEVVTAWVSYLFACVACLLLYYHVTDTMTNAAILPPPFCLLETWSTRRCSRAFCSLHSSRCSHLSAIIRTFLSYLGLAYGSRSARPGAKSGGVGSGCI